MTRTIREKELYRKYRVERLDGKPVGWCFVLQDDDPLACDALEVYAEAAWEAGNAELCEDLMNKVQHMRQMQASFRGDDSEATQ